MTHPLLPDLAGFSIEHVSIADGIIVVQAHTQRTSGTCPDCAHLSSRIHSRYQRQLADLPWSGRIVRLMYGRASFKLLRQKILHQKVT